MYEKNAFIIACTEKTCRKCMQLQCMSKLKKTRLHQNCFE